MLCTTFPATSTSTTSNTVYIMPTVFVLLLFALFNACTDAIVKLPEDVIVPAVFAFGDSLIDQGNNNHIITTAKANYLPYGKDLLVDGKPTGRFSNGKTAVDYLVEELGIKELLPAYLDPNLQSYDLPTGVSFASGASGFDPATSDITPCVSLSDQIKLFKDYIGKLTTSVGEANTSFIVKNSFYLVLSGNDDFIVNYFSPASKRKDYDVPAYANLLASFASNFVEELYQLGARRIAVSAVAPIGCIPALRTVNGGVQRSCADKYNQAAQLFNKKLTFDIQSLGNKLAQSRIVYIDLYGVLEDIIQNPKKYGFEIVDKGCCGTGYIEVAFLCNPLTAFCPDVSKHFFWDSFHPSEEGYKVLVNQILSKYLNQFF